MLEESLASKRAKAPASSLRMQLNPRRISTVKRFQVIAGVATHAWIHGIERTDFCGELRAGTGAGPIKNTESFA
jgi:hypothetical protein